MKLEDYLEIIREELGLDSIKEADRVVRVVVGALKLTLPDDKEKVIAEVLPDALAEGWENVEALSQGSADRTEMEIEIEGPGVQHDTPTITPG